MSKKFNAFRAKNEELRKKAARKGQYQQAALDEIARRAAKNAAPKPAKAKITPEILADERTDAAAQIKAQRKAIDAQATAYAEAHAAEGKFLRTKLAERTRLLVAAGLK